MNTAIFVIAGPDGLYWSNEDGWVDRDSATRFLAGEVISDPMGAVAREPEGPHPPFIPSGGGPH